LHDETSSCWVENVAENDGGNAELWDYAARELKQPFPDSGGCVALSLRGDRLATGNANQTIKIWDVADGQYVRSLKTGYVIALGLSPDGQTLATSYWAPEVKLWDVSTGLQIGSLTNNRPLLELGLSPDGRFLATGGRSNGSPWDMATRQQTELQGHGGEVMSVAFPPMARRWPAGQRQKGDALSAIPERADDVVYHFTRHLFS
jgi:WD40 repeat protein